IRSSSSWSSSTTRRRTSSAASSPRQRSRRSRASVSSTWASRRRAPRTDVRLTILHTNDLHGREDRIAQIATLVKRERATADHPVLYLDGGDVEENSVRLSSLTKGVAMHRLLSLTTCDVAAVGNGCWIRYGPQAVSEHARLSSYPQVVA